MTLTRLLAEFVHSIEVNNIPADVIEKAKTCLLNGYGIGLGCHNTPYAPVARRAVLSIDGEQVNGATILGDGRKTTVAGATLANAALFHGRAQEDICGSVHLGTVLIPLLTALVETRRAPVSRLLPSLVAGYEVGGILENEFTEKTSKGGFRASALYGTIAAAAAAGKAIGLNGEQLQSALANAASFTGGILQSFIDGTDEWRFQVGISGRLGLIAAELALAGSVSAPHAFEGKAGFIRTFARTEPDIKDIDIRLGSEWSIYRATFKPYPVCALNQTPVIAALALRGKIGVRGIEKIRVHMHPFEAGYPGLDYKGPFNSVSGTLMSVPFCIAATLLRGVPTMKIMTTYADSDINTLVDKTELLPDAAVNRLCCIIEVFLKDGCTISQDQMMNERDYSYDRETVSALIRRIGSETDLPTNAYDYLETFVENLPSADISLVIKSFSMLPEATLMRLP